MANTNQTYHLYSTYMFMCTHVVLTGTHVILSSTHVTSTYDVCTYLFTCAIDSFTPKFIKYFLYFRDGQFICKTIPLIGLFSLFRNLIVSQ